MNVTEFKKSYKRLLQLQDDLLKILNNSKADPHIILLQKTLLEHLRTISAEESITTFKIDISKSAPKNIDLEINLNLIKNISKERLQLMILEEKMPRKILEQIASIRFGMSAGNISSLATRGALIEKMITMMNHESTHESISRVARSNINSKN